MSNKLNEIKVVIENLGLKERFIISDLQDIAGVKVHTISSVDYPDLNPMNYIPEGDRIGGVIARNAKQEADFVVLAEALKEQGFDVSEVEINDELGAMDKLVYESMDSGQEGDLSPEEIMVAMFMQALGVEL